MRCYCSNFPMLRLRKNSKHFLLGTSYNPWRTMREILEVIEYFSDLQVFLKVQEKCCQLLRVEGLSPNFLLLLISHGSLQHIFARFFSNLEVFTDAKNPGPFLTMANDWRFFSKHYVPAERTGSFSACFPISRSFFNFQLRTCHSCWRSRNIVISGGCLNIFLQALRNSW